MNGVVKVVNEHAARLPQQCDLPNWKEFPLQKNDLMGAGASDLKKSVGGPLGEWFEREIQSDIPQVTGILADTVAGRDVISIRN